MEACHKQKGVHASCGWMLLFKSVNFYCGVATSLGLFHRTFGQSVGLSAEKFPRPALFSPTSLSTLQPQPCFPFQRSGLLGQKGCALVGSIYASSLSFHPRNPFHCPTGISDRHTLSLISAGAKKTPAINVRPGFKIFRRAFKVDKQLVLNPR